MMKEALDRSVELRVPVSPEYVSVVRLLVSGLGTRLGLAIDELDKLKLLVGEAFLTIVAQCEQVGGLMRFRWSENEDRVLVSLSDPSGKHKSVTDSGTLAMLRNLGG
jgi:anti-sigma regulatory factor (Ser/Thr protein kinase)